MSEGAYAIGCDIGVTNVKVVRVTRDGKVLSRHTADTNAASPQWPDGVRRFLRQIEAEHGPAESIGFAAPGLAAPDGTHIFWMQGRLGEVQGLNWTQFLARQVPVPVHAPDHPAKRKPAVETAFNVTGAPVGKPIVHVEPQAIR